MELIEYVNQTNWPTEMSEARAFAREAIGKWKHKKKAPEFLAKIDRATTIKRLQELVTYAVLSGEGQAVIKW